MPGHTPTSTAVGPTAAARIAGAGYVAIFVLAIFANFAVVERLITDDAGATLANLAADQTLVRLAVAAFLVVFAIDVVVAWALHRLLREHDEGMSLLAAWLRLVYTVFLGVAAAALFTAGEIAGGVDHVAAFDADQRASLVALALDAFEITWLIGLVTFGLHLVALGSIILRGRVTSPWVAAGLFAAGTVYVADTFLRTIHAGYDDHEALFAALVIVPAVIGELAFTVWLLRRGWGARAVGTTRTA